MLSALEASGNRKAPRPLRDGGLFLWPRKNALPRTGRPLHAGGESRLGIHGQKGEAILLELLELPLQLAQAHVAQGEGVVPVHVPGRLDQRIPLLAEGLHEMGVVEDEAGPGVRHGRAEVGEGGVLHAPDAPVGELEEVVLAKALAHGRILLRTEAEFKGREAVFEVGHALLQPGVLAALVGGFDAEGLGVAKGILVAALFFRC